METGVSYFGNRILRHVEADLEDIARHGCTFVVHTFSEDDLAYYRATMAQIVEATHRAGLEAWIDPWGVGSIFGGEAFSAYVAYFPEHRQVLSSGQPVPAACPNHPHFRAVIRDWVEAALGTGADVVFWDEPHWFFPGWTPYPVPSEGWACRCQVCRRLYREQTGEEMPVDRTPSVRAFQEESLLSFLDEMTQLVKRRGGRNALCVLPTSSPSFVSAAAALPAVEIFGTDPYWYFLGESVEGAEAVREFVGHFARWIVDLCSQHGKTPHLWVQAFRVPAGREEEIAVAVEAAAEAGVEVLAAWGYAGCGHMSHVASERPDVVWETLGRAFRTVRRAT